uniref:CmpX protein n=1 Tax=uncultured Microgenomates bacterium Rifle_16ft_4_minimus_38077 TaxID=1665117 RepID=A0A0H4T9M5_9BACT|nr:CmpX protein [uncultured Microgenomates bacterium Rifle_16ft_4_minimus_38077]
MNGVLTWQQALISSWGQVWTSVLLILPRFLGAIVVFAIGLILAFWVKRLVIQFLKVVRFEKLAQSTGVDKYLKKADIKLSLVDLLGTVFEWIIILVFFLAVVDILGLSVVSTVLAQVLGYVPNVLASALIFAAGYIVAGFVDGLVRGALASVDHDAAKPVGRLARWVIIVVAAFAAIDQLQIARNFIATFFQGLTYTIVLVVGLSVGLGAKDLVAKILNDWYEKIRK